jgi:hypothetical protein
MHSQEVHDRSRPRRPAILLAACAALLSAAVVLRSAMPSAVHAAATNKKCKIVKKHGKKKRVCKASKPHPTATATATATPTATATSTATATATATSTPKATSTATATATETTIDPTIFAPALSDFPPGSTFDTNQVESNAATVDSLFPHFGPSFDQEGRTGGYYVVGVQPNDGHTVLTMYLVSIFPSAVQARATLAEQRAGFDAEGDLSTPPLPGYGDQAARYVVGITSPYGLLIYSEWFFTRGRVLIETAQANFVDDVNYAQAAAPYSVKVARRLDVTAAQAQGINLSDRTMLATTDSTVRSAHLVRLSNPRIRQLMTRTLLMSRPQGPVSNR